MTPQHSTSGLPEGRRVRLRPLEPADYPWVYRMANAPEMANRWFQRPGTANPQNFEDALWLGVLCQFVAEGRESREPIALVTGYSHDAYNRTAFARGYVDPLYHGRGWPVEAFTLLVGYMFESYDLRKIYAEAFEFNTGPYKSAGLLEQNLEARFREHTLVDGKYRDLLTFALYPPADSEIDGAGGPT